MKYSKLPRIYVPSKLQEGNIVALFAENYNILKNVMRLKNGFNLRAFNEHDGEFIAVFNTTNKNTNIEIIELFRKPNLISKHITLLAAIIKQDKFEQICDMAVQLGVTQIIPIITERVQKKEINKERIKKIILESVRQSERLDIPKLSEPINLTNLNNTSFEKIFWANETENKISTFEYANEAAALIGPEGGFTDEEIDFLNKMPNVISVSLGENVLRAETAAIALLTRILT